MKDRNDKHKFKESKIGKIIYSFLLFMPLFAIGVTCGYAMFNKNAYKSYNEKISNTYLIDNSNNSFLSENNNYIFNGFKKPVYTSGTGWTTTNKFTFSNSSVNLREYFNLNFNVNGLAISTDGNYNNYFKPLFHDENLNTWVTGNVIYYSNNEFTKYSNLKFTFTLNTYDSNFYKSYNIIYTIYENGKVDNVFYYSVDKVTQSNLFNWVTTSNIYTGMSNFTTAMSVTNTFIPMLLTYWLIISVIYFLYDMVLILLTVLHRKIHNLQDSI